MIVVSMWRHICTSISAKKPRFPIFPGKKGSWFWGEPQRWNWYQYSYVIINLTARKFVFQNVRLFLEHGCIIMELCALYLSPYFRVNACGNLDPHLAAVYLAKMTCSLYIRPYSISCQTASASTGSLEPAQTVLIHSLDCGQCKFHLLKFGIFSAQCHCFNVRGVLLFSARLCACSSISTSKLWCLIRYVYILTYSVYRTAH